MTEKLKPCPFCEEEAMVEKLNLGKEGLFRVICPQCLTATNLREEEKNAVAEWNSRPIEDDLQKKLDEAREDNADNMEYHVAERKRLKELLKSCCNEFVKSQFKPCHRVKTVDAKGRCTARATCPIYAELTKGGAE